MGPIRLPGGRGTLTAADRDRIWQATGVSASVRWRSQWGERCLTLSGPAPHLTEALRLSNEAISHNGDGDGDGGADHASEELQVLRVQNRTLQAEVQHIRGQMTQMGAFVTSLDTRLQETRSSVQGILHRLDKRTRNRKRKKHRRRRHPPQEESDEDERGHSAQRKEERENEEKSPEETDESTDENDEKKEEDRNEAPEKKDEKQEETMKKEESSSSSSDADGGTAPEASGAAHNKMPGAAGSGMEVDHEGQNVPEEAKPPAAGPSASVKEEIDKEVDRKLKARAEELKDPHLGEKCVQTGLLDKLTPEYKRIREEVTKEMLEKAEDANLTDCEVDTPEPSQEAPTIIADEEAPTLPLTEIKEETPLDEK
eukprot:s1590_g34.t1